MVSDTYFRVEVHTSWGWLPCGPTFYSNQLDAAVACCKQIATSALVNGRVVEVDDAHNPIVYEYFCSPNGESNQLVMWAKEGF